MDNTSQTNTDDFVFDADDHLSAPVAPSPKPIGTTSKIVAPERKKTGVGGKNYEFKARARQLVDATIQGEAILRILRDSDHPQFMRALEFLADRGYGKVTDNSRLQIDVRPVVMLPQKDAEPMDTDYELLPSGEPVNTIDSND